MAHRPEDNEAAYWLKILHSDTFWLLGVFLYLNNRFIQTQIREVVKDRPGRRPTTEAFKYTYEYVGLPRLRHNIKTRFMMIVVSCLVTPLLVLEGCCVYLLHCKLVSLLFSLLSDDPWKPYFLWTTYLLLATALSTIGATVWTFLAARLLKAQVSYIRALINLPIPPNGTNSPESALSGAFSTATRPPRTPEPTSSILPPSPKMAPLRQQFSSTTIVLVEADKHFPAGSPPPRPDGQNSGFWKADYIANQSAPTTIPAAQVSNRASSEYPEWWESPYGSSTTPDMSPPVSPRLPVLTTSSTPPTSDQQDSEDAGVAAHVENTPMESFSIAVPSRTFREPVSTNTTRFPDQRTRGRSTSSGPDFYGSRWRT
ncbi:Ff.00g027900.m01.CDS01 [Fusarium sp. VM40]|nr:Ff.00g027900.m01.CDS01 [Fusarium sp. VM40]